VPYFVKTSYGKPEIQTVRQGGFNLCCIPLDENLLGSGRQLMKTSRLAQFESYVAKGAHGVKTNMGIHNPVGRAILR